MIVLSGIVYAAARVQVLLRSRALGGTVARSCDELSPSSVPSICLGDERDRVLAEVDQDGRCFAVDPQDENLFNTSAVKHPRRHHEILIILKGGKIRVRKRLLPSRDGRFAAQLLGALGFGFYIEAAALLRLRGFAGVPTVRHIDTHRRIIEMDYIWGRDLRQEIVEATNVQSCAEVDRIFWNRIKVTGNAFGNAVRDLVEAVMARGVLPADIHAANFIRGKNTGQLYMVDYHLVYFKPLPGWRSHQEAVVRQLQTITL
jgi:hypothetical protein